MHDLLILADHLVLRLLQLLVSVAYLGLKVGHSHLQLIVDGLHFSHLSRMLLCNALQMVFKLLDELLLVFELFAEDFDLFDTCLDACVILVGHLELNVVFLQLLYLFVQVIKFGLVLFYFLFILGDPLLIFGGKLNFVLLELLNLFLPLVVTLGLEKLDLCLQLLNHVVFLLELHRVEPLSRVVAALIASVNRRQ